jgi:type IV secretory pathway protease TraF
MFERSRSVLVLGGAVAAALAAAALTAPRDLLLYNDSPSVPEGIYVRTSVPVTVGAFVTVRARDVAPDEAHRRGFEDASDRFIKRVAAAAGARVCGDGRRLSVEGEDIVVVGADEQQHHNGAGAGDVTGGDGGGLRRRAVVRVVRVVDDDDEAHQRIAGWRGCRTLADGEVLLLGDTPDSFDGRYWGPVSVDLIEGVWRKL